ncbi:MAG: bifunctional alpha/beta hydrolase/OsmC family protein [Proteobacteria bacterium]|nr:bifunctional alpha/beta hydrolase/OsmC family protein [Pseudomonadota bacterium]
METEKLEFEGSQGARLAARLDRPLAPARATALFAHCFTCSKDLAAASRLARGLAGRGIAVLRFDFTGLGHSEGEFAHTDFSSNVEDLVRAADFLRERGQAPSILVGHSLGGAAVLAAAPRVPEVRAVATIGAPSDPAHVKRLLTDDLEEIESRGQATVELAGRAFQIRREFLDDLDEQRLLPSLEKLRRALLVMHSPVDTVVGIENATRLYQAAKHPKSFVSLDTADHLLSRREDAAYAAEVLAAWAARFLPESESDPAATPAEGEVVVEETGEGRFHQSVAVGRHRLVADEPATVGGTDRGPAPYDFLLAGLGACTSMTLRLYAERKGWPLERVSVRLRHSKIHATDCEACETQSGRLDRIDRAIALEGPLSVEQKERLLEMADRCPVHRTLESEVEVRTREA